MAFDIVRVQNSRRPLTRSQHAVIHHSAAIDDSRTVAEFSSPASLDVNDFIAPAIYPCLYSRDIAGFIARQENNHRGQTLQVSHSDP